MNKAAFIFSTLVLAMALLAQPAVAGGKPLSTSLSGSEEVAVGDPDGSGQADLTLNQGTGKVCWTIDVDNVDLPGAAHIHKAVAGQNGDVVVELFGASSAPTSYPASACVTANKALIKDIRKNPSSYYVNVHNAMYPAGALRGQLGD